MATGIRKAVWRSAVLADKRLPGTRGRLIGLAGPVILLATFASWITLLTLGLALAVWPMLEEGFSAPPDLLPLGFLDALYFAGGTVPVLGYGDITPLSAEAKLVSMFGAAVGFSLFTGMATYAVQVTSGMATRNRFTLSVHDETRGGGGVALFARYLALEGVGGARDHCRSWTGSLREVADVVHRYPLVALTYRSHHSDHDPEPVLHHASESAVAALVASGHEISLRPSAETLCAALTRLQVAIADTYLDGDLARRLEDPRPSEDDHRAVRTVEHLLRVRVPDLGSGNCPDPGPAPDTGDVHRAAAETVYRCRLFLEGLHAWSHTEVPPREWDVR